MSLNDTEKINYITNNFHQYFDIGLNTNISTTETINLVIPIEDLTNQNTINDSRESYHHNVSYKENYNITSILNKYSDTEYEYDIKCHCIKVFDGDTIEVSIPCEENGEVVYKHEVIRLVGVNTPESGKNGYDVSKDFLRKVCYDSDYYNKMVKLDNNSPLTDGEENIENKKWIYLKFDNKKKYDTEVYKRRLAVLIFDNKNINEVLLKEGLAEIWYIPPSDFSPYEWGNPNTSVHVYNLTNSDIMVLSPYFNSEMTNIIFTPKTDYKTIYKFEVYKGVIYVRLNPFCQYIRMHILPKEYDCSNTILFFRDDMLKKNNIKKSNDYSNYPINIINSYYLDLVNNKIRDRTNPDISSEKYNVNDWDNTYCEFSYDISKNTRTLKNLQICAGYRYNNSTPFYCLHYTGVKDNTSIHIEDRCSLIDANHNEITKNKTNNITQFYYNNQNKLYIPNPKKVSNTIRSSYKGQIDHISQEKIGELNHKILKYINDTLYSQENINNSLNDNEIENRYTIGYWEDISQ